MGAGGRRGAPQDRHTDPLKSSNSLGQSPTPQSVTPQSPYRPAAGPPDPPKGALLLAPPGPGSVGIKTDIAALAYKGLMDVTKASEGIWAGQYGAIKLHGAQRDR